MSYFKFEYLKKVEAAILERLVSILDVFASEVCTKLVVQSDKLSWIELIVTNALKSRAIQIIVSEGINADYMQSYGIRCNIQKMDEHKEVISSFSIRDYCNGMNLKFGIKDFFTEPDDFLIELKNYLEVVNGVLETEKMRAIIFDEYWIEIKPNLYPYK